MISSAQRWQSDFIDVGDTNFNGFVVILLCHRKKIFVYQNIRFTQDKSDKSSEVTRWIGGVK